MHKLVDKYDFHIVTAKQLGDNTIKICEVAVSRNPGVESGTLEQDSKRYLLQPTKKKSSSNKGKLSEHICRAKTKVKELVLCNDWDWWCTFTLDSNKMDRYDLKAYIKALGEFLHNYNKRTEERYKVKYLLVPEKHKDGAWHMHGFVKGIKPADLYVNKHGYYTWKQYEEKFGFISMSPVKDKEKSSSYVLKYMGKDMNTSVTELGAHLYYASKGLKQPEILFRGHAELHGEWDYIHPDGYCKLKYIDTRKTDLSEVLERTE